MTAFYHLAALVEENWLSLEDQAAVRPLIARIFHGHPRCWQVTAHAAH